MSEAQPHTVQLDQFEGPLDLLLFLIRRNEINIYDIPIARITEQYLAYLEYAARIDLERLTEFYVMAATLLYIKSRMLLPAGPALDEDPGEDPRTELVEKLIEYQRFRKLSDLMQEREEQLDYVVERRTAQPSLPFEDDDDLWREVDVWELLNVFSRIVSSLSHDRLVDLYEEVTVNEKLTLIEELLETRGEFLFENLIRRNSVLEVVCAFIAILEAARRRAIAIKQNRLFGDIRVVRNPEPPSPEADPYDEVAS